MNFFRCLLLLHFQFFPLPLFRGKVCCGNLRLAPGLLRLGSNLGQVSFPTGLLLLFLEGSFPSIEVVSLLLRCFLLFSQALFFGLDALLEGPLLRGKLRLFLGEGFLRLRVAKLLFR